MSGYKDHPVKKKKKKKKTDIYIKSSPPPGQFPRGPRESQNIYCKPPQGGLLMSEFRDHPREKKKETDIYIKSATPPRAKWPWALGAGPECIYIYKIRTPPR